MSLIPIDYFRVRHHLELPHAGHFADGAAVTAGQQQVKKIDYDTDTGFYLVLSHDGTVFHIPREAAAFHVVKKAEDAAPKAKNGFAVRMDR